MLPLSMVSRLPRASACTTVSARAGSPIEWCEYQRGLMPSCARDIPSSCSERVGFCVTLRTDHATYLPRARSAYPNFSIRYRRALLGNLLPTGPARRHEPPRRPRGRCAVARAGLLHPVALATPAEDREGMIMPVIRRWWAWPGPWMLRWRATVVRERIALRIAPWLRA